jgi:hypothetical protein
VAGGGALDRGKLLAGGGDHGINDVADVVLLLEGDIKVHSPLPNLLVSGENRRRACVVPFKKASP